MRIRANTLDGDPGARPLVQAFVDFKAPWCTITADVPQFATRAGTLDGGPGARPLVQAFVDFKAPW